MVLMLKLYFGSTQRPASHSFLQTCYF